MISVEEAWEVAQGNNVPLIVDAAAEDIQKYVKYSDLAIYSGSKAIEGPTSGIVGGKRKYIDWLKVQLHCIGRSMKVGKETTFGLLQALDEYGVKKIRVSKKKLLQVLMPLKELNGVNVTIVQDEAGRAIFRARIHINEKELNKSAKDVVTALREGKSRFIHVITE